MKSRELQKTYWDWLSTAERLLRSLNEQRAALTLRSRERVEQIQPELEMMLTRMNEIDQQAVALTNKLAEAFGVLPNLRSIAGALKDAEARQLESLGSRVRAVGESVNSALELNKRLIEAEMEYISGTFAIVCHAMTENKGQFAQAAVDTSILVNQVA